MSIPFNCFDLSDADVNTCMNCRKRKRSLINELSFNELSILEGSRHVVSYKPGETIYKEGTKPTELLCLSEGKVKITRKGAFGGEQIVALKKPVDFIGFRALMGGEMYSTTAVALENSNLCFIDKKDFFEVIANNSRLAFKIIQFLALELTEGDQRLVNLTQKHMRARLADAVLLTHDIYGSSPVDGMLNVLLKRAELAALANMTTANAIRMLSAFAKEDLIEIHRRKIKINNLKALREISISGR